MTFPARPGALQYLMNGASGRQDVLQQEAHSDGRIAGQVRSRL
jgi:hypothetical protein